MKVYVRKFRSLSKSIFRSQLHIITSRLYELPSLNYLCLQFLALVFLTTYPNLPRQLSLSEETEEHGLKTDKFQQRPDEIFLHAVKYWVGEVSPHAIEYKVDELFRNAIEYEVDMLLPHTVKYKVDELFPHAIKYKLTSSSNTRSNISTVRGWRAGNWLTKRNITSRNETGWKIKTNLLGLLELSSPFLFFLFFSSLRFHFGLTVMEQDVWSAVLN